MRDRKTPTLSALAAALLLFVGVPHTGDAASIRWHKTLQQATAAAVKTNKPIMIEFWADWCEPCQVMEKEVYSEPKIAGLIEATVVPLRLSFDNDKPLVRRYEVEAIPYLIFGNSYGTELLHHRGILAAKDLSAIIRALPSDISEINRLDLVLQKASAFERCLKDFPNGESRPWCQAGVRQAYALMGRKIE